MKIKVDKKRLIAFALAVSIISFKPLFSYCEEIKEGTQNLDKSLYEQKDKIRRLHNQAAYSYEDIYDKIKKEKEEKRVEETRKKIEDYYNTAKILEARGEYKNAERCYRKILNLTDNRVMRIFIADENKRLKVLAQRQKRDALIKLKDEKKNAWLESELWRKKADKEKAVTKKKQKKARKVVKREDIKYERYHEIYKKALESLDKAYSKPTPDAIP